MDHMARQGKGHYKKFYIFPAYLYIDFSPFTALA